MQVIFPLLMNVNVNIVSVKVMKKKSSPNVCTLDKVNENKMTFLMQNISVNMDLINQKTKRIFQYAVHELEKKFPLIIIPKQIIQ